MISREPPATTKLSGFRPHRRCIRDFLVMGSRGRDFSGIPPEGLGSLTGLPEEEGARSGLQRCPRLRRQILKNVSQSGKLSFFMDLISKSHLVRVALLGRCGGDSGLGGKGTRCDPPEWTHSSLPTLPVQPFGYRVVKTHDSYRPGGSSSTGTASSQRMGCSLGVCISARA